QRRSCLPAERKPTSLTSSDSSQMPTGTPAASTMDSGAGRITQIVARGLLRAMTGMPVMWPANRLWRRWRRPFAGWATSRNSGDQNQLIQRHFQRANGAEQDVLFCRSLRVEPGVAAAEAAPLGGDRCLLGRF